VRQIDFILFVILLQTLLYFIHETEEYVFPGGFAHIVLAVMARKLDNPGLIVSLVLNIPVGIAIGIGIEKCSRFPCAPHFSRRAAENV